MLCGFLVNIYSFAGVIALSVVPSSVFEVSDVSWKMWPMEILKSVSIMSRELSKRAPIFKIELKSSSSSSLSSSFYQIKFFTEAQSVDRALGRQTTMSYLYSCIVKATHFTVYF